MAEEQQTVWITKYALTKGIEEQEAFVDPAMNMAAIKGRYSCNYFHGNEWHSSREAAIARAEEMRTAKIASHEKSIAKLKKLTFA